MELAASNYLPQHTPMKTEETQKEELEELEEKKRDIWCCQQVL